MHLFHILCELGFACIATIGLHTVSAPLIILTVCTVDSLKFCVCMVELVGTAIVSILSLTTRTLVSARACVCLRLRFVLSIASPVQIVTTFTHHFGNFIVSFSTSHTTDTAHDGRTTNSIITIIIYIRCFLLQMWIFSKMK